MGYRLLVSVFVAALMISCAAFDSSQGEPFEGFAPDEVPATAGATQGIYNGYYDGVQTLDSNSCQSISESIGTQSDLAVDVAHQGATINVTFEDGVVTAGSLEGKRVTLLTAQLGVRHIYYLEFSEEAVGGSQEVFEQDEKGQYSKPCASYTIELEKGKKPEGEGEAKEGEEEKEE